MENNHQVIHKHKLEVLSILKEALTISCKSIKFIILTFLASLPFLCFWVFHETYFQRTLVEASEIVMTPSHYYSDWRPMLRMVARELNELFSSKMIILCLCLFPLHLLKLCSILATVTLASSLYPEEKPLILKEIIHNSIGNGKSRLKYIFITYIFVLFCSTCFLVGLIWLLLNYFVIFRYTLYNVYFAVVLGGAFLVLLVKYSEASAEWNMAIVISIVEKDLHGVESLALSACFSRGNWQRGRLLVLIFFAWGIALRLSCLYVGCYRRGNGIFMQLGFIFMGNVIKWVAFVVYFYECKKDTLDMQVDEEVQVLVQSVEKRVY